MSSKPEGKKIFFLYPQSVIEELAKELVRHEYEVYLIKDRDIVLDLIRISQNSILYINIDEILKEEEWEEYINSILNNDDLNKKVDIGLLTYRRKEHLVQKYLLELGIKGGYIEIDLKIKNTLAILLKLLDVNEAKGRRKYLRINSDKNAKFNIEFTNPNSSFGSKDYINGTINNISSFGMACKIIDEKYKDILVEKLKLNSIQLNLKGLICIVTGEIHLKREEFLIIKFDEKTEPFVKNKIYHYIYNELQNNMEKEIEIIRKSKA